METPELTSAEYWESDAIDIRINPKRKIDTKELKRFLQVDCGMRGVVVMATSGSSGTYKFVVLKKEALLVSAEAVVNHCGLTAGDVWLAGLSDFHVGGLGIFSRAFLAGSRVKDIGQKKWQRDGKEFVEAIQHYEATVTSMTPTHLYDLVNHSVKCPRSLRGVLVGGGRIDPCLIDAAVGLGWPVWPSYGMTEAGSQIATSLHGEVEWLPILPIWESKTKRNGRLAIRGEALFSGYAVKSRNKWKFDTARDRMGWFETGDCCEVSRGLLKFGGRADDLVKVSGEFVSVSNLEFKASHIARRTGAEAAVLAVPDNRRENELVLIVEGDAKQAERISRSLNESVDRIENVTRLLRVDRLPRTEIGKIERNALRDMAADKAVPFHVGE